jgi:hypothetical protein
VVKHPAEAIVRGATGYPDTVLRSAWWKARRSLTR